MFVAGTHVPVRDPRLRPGSAHGRHPRRRRGSVAVALGYGVAQLVDTSHALLYAVLMASSSAAIVLPAVDSLGLDGPDLVDLLPQVAIADSLCIVLLPLVIDPDHVGRAAVGAVVVIAAGVVLFLLLRWVERSGWRTRVHDVSEDRQFAVELRVSLAAVFAMAALAVGGPRLPDAGRLRLRARGRGGRRTAPRGQAAVRGDRGLLRAAVLRLARGDAPAARRWPTTPR